MYNMMQRIQNYNNGALSGAKPMPLKDSTSNNESSFNMSRQTYIETAPASPITNEIRMKKMLLVQDDIHLFLFLIVYFCSG